jgi:hypothetical protein
MHTRPTPDDLVATVRAYLAELQQRVDPVDQFQVRVSVHLLGIAERQLSRGAEVDARERAALADFVEADGPPTELHRELCRRIRSGDLDERWQQLVAALVRVAADEVAIVAPEKLS